MTHSAAAAAVVVVVANRAYRGFAVVVVVANRAYRGFMVVPLCGWFEIFTSELMGFETLIIIGYRCLAATKSG
jgi:hypothetical protein